MNIYCYLKEKVKGESKKAPIMIYLTHGSDRLRVSTGITIPVEAWDAKRKKIKSSYPGSVELNGSIKQMEHQLQKKFAKAFEQDSTVNMSELRETFKLIRNPQKVQEQVVGDIWDVFEKFVEYCRMAKGSAVIKSYYTTRNHLKEYEKKSKRPLEFSSFAVEFYEKYIHFLSTQKNLTNNSIGKDIKNLKVFLRWTTDKGFNKRLDFIKFKVLEEEADSFVLREDELKAIEMLDLRNNDKLSKVRDCFLFMVYTSLRVGDYLNIAPSNFNLKEGLIRLTATKTKGEQVIAITPKLKMILDRYPDLNFPKFSKQEINRSLKKIGQLAGMNEPFQIVKYSGTKRIEIEKPRYMFLVNKIGRRTNITLSLKSNVPESIVRKQSGHKTNKHFTKYIKMSGEDVKEAMNNVNIWK